MALKTFSYLCSFWLCLVTSGTLKIPSIKDKHFIDQCVDSHNNWRGQVSPFAANMKYMKWDKNLAKLAKEGAKNCKFEHRDCLGQPYGCNNKFEYIGENIWLGDLNKFTPNNAVTSWYNEHEYYNFESMECSQTCGHYTQVVWANSDKVGCSANLCPNLGIQSTTLFICNYGPGGNLLQTQPYKKGVPCSLCSAEDKCIRKLCRTLKIVLPDKSKAERTIGKSPQWITFSIFSINFILLKMF